MGRSAVVLKVVADAARVATAVSAVVMVTGGRWEPAGRFALITLVMLVPRYFRVPPFADALFAVALLVATWSSVAHWYLQVPRLDDVVHFVAPGAVAAVAYFVLVALGALPGLGSPEARRHRWAPVLLVGALGTSAAVVWEQYEWLAEQLAPTSVVVGYGDTVFDLLAGLLGSLTAGVVVVWRGARVPTT